MAKQYLVIDVETPNRRNDRICSITAILIVDGVITEKLVFLVDPEADFERFNIDLHGITEETVANAKTFPEVWCVLGERFNRSVIVAHNAPFDIKVVESCCNAYSIPFQRPQYVDTVQLSRAALPGLSHHRLSDVCQAMGIPLDHHNAESDCEACATIFLRCAADGMDVQSYERQYKAQEGEPWRGQSARTTPPPPVRTKFANVSRPRRNKKGMPTWVKVVLVLAVVVFVLPQCGTNSGKSTEKPTVPAATSSAAPAEEQTPQYLEKIQWAQLHNYKCAVERDDFDGDVLAAGKYTAYPSATDNLGKGDVPIVWDIYVSKHNYDTMDELTEKEHVATVGGWNNDSATFKLRKGRYVYIKYNDMAGKPVGILNIKRKSGK